MKGGIRPDQGPHPVPPPRGEGAGKGVEAGPRPERGEEEALHFVEGRFSVDLHGKRALSLAHGTRGQYTGSGETGSSPARRTLDGRFTEDPAA
jgi:hypothetical protein